MKGPNVMSGYLNNPEATAATLDADGYLHTGDVAMVTEDGVFTIVDRVKELIARTGDRLVESFSDGPASKDLKEASLTFEAWGKVAVADVTVVKANESAGLYNHLQDYRDFGPVHGSGQGGSGNILFADGSVKSFVDANADGFLNPGFAWAAGRALPRRPTSRKPAIAATTWNSPAPRSFRASTSRWKEPTRRTSTRSFTARKLSEAGAASRAAPGRFLIPRTSGDAICLGVVDRGVSRRLRLRSLVGPTRSPLPTADAPATAPIPGTAASHLAQPCGLSPAGPGRSPSPSNTISAIWPSATGADALIRNDGDAPLTLRDGSTSCYCTELEVLDKSVPPGGTGRVSVSFEPKGEGDLFLNTAGVITNDAARRNLSSSSAGSSGPCSPRNRPMSNSKKCRAGNREPSKCSCIRRCCTTWRSARSSPLRPGSR